MVELLNFGHSLKDQGNQIQGRVGCIVLACGVSVQTGDCGEGLATRTRQT